MSQLDDEPETFELDDRCIVPWKDGSVYAGKVQKILDPDRMAIIQGVPHRKNGKLVLVEDATPIEKLKSERHRKIPKDVLESALDTHEKWYYVHYSGWKANYDEWLPLQRMLPHTPRNINEMKRINSEIKEREKRRKEEELKLKKGKKRGASPAVEAPAAHQARAPKRPYAAATREATPAEGAPAPTTKHRRKVLLGDEPLYEVRLAVPLELKRLLVKDWQLVTRDRELVRLPRPACVVEILKDFANASTHRSTTGESENIEHFVDSIRTYFDYSFGMLLLYRFERNQYYAQQRKDANFQPSLIYGAEHLARLIVSMPALLSQLTSMDDITLQFAVQQLEKLSTFLAVHRVRYFAGEKSYDSATREYESQSVPHLAAEPGLPAEVSETPEPGSALDDTEVE